MHEVGGGCVVSLDLAHTPCQTRWLGSWMVGYGSLGFVMASAPLGGMTTQPPPTSFHALNLALEFISGLKPLVDEIVRHDKELGRQLRKAATSVALNLGEGRKRMGKDRQYLWSVACGSAEESRTCLLVAQAWRYIDDGDQLAAVLAVLDQLVAISWSLSRR